MIFTKKNKKMLVSGDSYTYDTVWPTLLRPDLTVINLGKLAAGNTYIAESIIAAIDPSDLPEYVFVLWGLVNRVDVAVPVTPETEKFFKTQKYHARIKDSFYYFTGGDHFSKIISDNYSNLKDPEWPAIKTIDDFLKLPDAIQQECFESKLFSFSPYSVEGRIQNYVMLQYLTNKSYLESVTLKNVLACQQTLARFGIPYNFAFSVDPFSKTETVFKNNGFGYINKRNTLLQLIDWDKYVSLPPYNYAVKYDCLADDQLHMSIIGQQHWAAKIKEMI